MALLFQELHKQLQIEIQTDEDAYTNIGSNLQTSPEAITTEIIADVLEVKTGPEIEADSDHEEEEPYKPIVTKENALEYIDGLRNYISTLNDTRDRGYDKSHSLKKKDLISGNSHQTQMGAFFLNQ